MYNPSRGGVRGGADQFTWESVKTDKHRENYLGHSLMAPVGRWQKGKDLSWYAKERKGDKTQEMIDRSEMASIKKAEEEAMLIALGHNIVKKTQTLTKEDMREALKRNTEREDHQIERIDGVGAASQRIASLSGVGKDARQNNEGVAFETVKERNIIETNDSDKGGESMPGERKKNKKKSKKHKKEKKHKKHHKESRESDASDDSSKYKTKYDKNESDDDNRKSSKIKHLKKSKHSHKDYASDSDSPDSADERSSNLKDHKIFKPRGGDYVDSDSLDKEKGKSLKGRNHKKCKNRHKDYSSDSDSPDNADERRSSNLKDHKIFKPRGGDYVDSDSLDKEKGKSLKVRNHKKCKNRHKDYSSDSDSPDNADERRSSILKDHKIFKSRGGDYVDSDSLDKEKGKSLKVRNHKKCKNRHKDYSSDSDSPDNADERRSSNLKDHKIFKPRGGDYVDSDSLDKGKSLKVRNHKKCKNRYKDYSSDSDSPASVVQHKTKHKKSKLDGDVKKSSKEKSHKKSKHKHKDYSSEISDEISHPDSQKRDNKRHKIQKESVKRCRHDTSEND